MGTQKRETKNDKAGSGSLIRRKQRCRATPAMGTRTLLLFQILQMHPEELSEAAENDESSCNKKDEDAGNNSPY